ncbi:MAG: hypothetical protein U1E56_13710 [Bauldia sp.]
MTILQIIINALGIGAMAGLSAAFMSRIGATRGEALTIGTVGLLAGCVVLVAMAWPV